MSVASVPKHEGTGVHACCMDERITCESHRRETYDAHQGGAFELNSAGGGFRLLQNDATMWEDLEIALSINPQLNIVVCAHTHCAGAVKMGLLEQGLDDETQIKQSYAHLDKVGERLEQRFRTRYPEFTYELNVVDVRTGKIAPRG